LHNSISMVGYSSYRGQDMNKDFSLLDANLARVKEGLRVMEDIVRFVFADKELFEAVKVLRHSLSQTEAWFGTAHIMRGRFGTDIGTDQTVKTEFERSSMYSIIRANASRVTEALRTLEEFAKIYTNKNAFLFQKARYQVYALERDLMMRTPHFYLYQYFEEGIVYPISDSIEDLKDFIDAGAKVVQLRDKSGNKQLIQQKVKELSRYLQKRYSEGKEKVVFILNDHVDLAARLPVDGVHIGQDDGEVLRARIHIGSNKIIGRSTHSTEQANKAVLDGADYIGVGPIYATPTKSEGNAIGLETLEIIAETVPIPLAAIGGINPGNKNDVHAHGARNVAVVRSAKQFFEKK